jgi:hypothetical protein
MMIPAGARTSDARPLVLRVLDLESRRASSSDTVFFQVDLALATRRRKQRSCNELNHVAPSSATAVGVSNQESGSDRLIDYPPLKASLI